MNGMSPAQAYARLLATGPFDDPIVSWYPVRWYFDPFGVMCRQPWRGPVTRYPDFVADDEEAT